MLGAMCGDIIGSIYEEENNKNKVFPLFSSDCRFTDDSVMTGAISLACKEYLKDKSFENFEGNCIKYMRNLGICHLNAGYGGNFFRWIISDNPQPFYSYGNGSAMRVSPVALVATSLDETEKLAEISARVTHNHPDGIAGAKAVACSLWLIKNGATKDAIKKYVEDNYYDLNFEIDKIRDNYQFDVSCKGSVPQAIVCFLESNDFEDAIRNAISLGGDSDTIAAICGSLAEFYYGVPKEISSIALEYLDEDLLYCLSNFYNLKELKKQQNEK